MFHEEHLGPTRQEGPPHAVVSATKPIAFVDPDGYQVTLHDRA